MPTSPFLRIAMYRYSSFLAATIVLLLTACDGPSTPAYDTTACAGPPLKTIEARNEALEAGYEINRSLDCIDRKSFDQVQQQKAADTAARKAAQLEAAAKPSVAPATTPAPTPPQTRAAALQGFKTALAGPPEPAPPLPNPPANLFVRSNYLAVTNPEAPAFVTPDPKDGRKHPAIVWLTGGDPSALGDFWTPGPDSNDQSARAFREAGVVMMFPTLRGNTQHGGHREQFLGEVLDVLAAADHLARLPYVDMNRIYLGGHSTGGTLALLAAETSDRFAAVFAFGPVADIDRYRAGLFRLAFEGQDPRERTLRSPVHWLAGIAAPTYVIEGTGGNIDDLETLCRASRNPMLMCIPVAGETHFGVLAKVTRVIAARIAMTSEGIPFSLTREDFRTGAAVTTPR